jgi:eukaryotic-like serine/threonine-protein kinase
MQTKTNSWSRSSIVRKQQELIANKGLDTTTIQSEERYAVQNKLGEGGMGQVYKTTDLDLKRPVALKTLKAEFAQDRDQLLQFIQEAQSTGRLEHPSIPPVHELGLSDEGLVYFTMKLVNGVTLSEVITKLREGDRETHRRFSFDYRAQVMIALCQAVHFANTSGVFHRDIKPDNIMLGQHGEILLMDWGASFDLLTRGERPEEPDFIGTPAYAAPERFGDPDAACIATSEVFSLGVVMYELFTLKTAYEAKSMRELISQVMGTDLPPAYKAQSPFQTPCPAEYSHIIRRATLRNEKERIENAGVLGEEIQLALQNMSAVVCPCTGVKRVLSVLDRIVNAWGGAGAAFVFIWQILPFILVALLLWQHLK